MRWAAPVVTLAFLVLSLAGCSGSNTTLVTTTVATRPPLAADKGAISGLLIDDRYRPVAGALILLKPLGRTSTSDAEGQFVFLDLDPGSYLLQVQAKDHEAAPKNVDVQAGQYTNAEVEARRLFSDAGAIVTTEFSIFIDCSYEAVVVTQSGSLRNGLPNCMADLSGDSSRAYFLSSITPTEANLTTYFITESVSNQDVPYMLSIGWFNDQEFLENYTYAQQNVDSGRYGRLQLEANKVDNRTHESDDTNNRKWSPQNAFFTFLYPHGTGYQQIHEQAGLWGAGVVLGFKGKIVQSLFLGKPTVEIGTYGVLKPQ